jgi:hypothetical protein
MPNMGKIGFCMDQEQIADLFSSIDLNLKVAKRCSLRKFSQRPATIVSALKIRKFSNHKLQNLDSRILCNMRVTPLALKRDKPHSLSARPKVSTSPRTTTQTDSNLNSEALMSYSHMENS